MYAAAGGARPVEWGRTTIKDAELLDASDRILANAKEHEKVFIAHRYPKDFIAKAQAAADALRDKLADPNTVVSRRSTATFALKPAIKRGRKVMDSIDKNVAAELSGDAAALSRWARAYRVPRKLGRPKNNRRGRPIYPPPDENKD